MSQIKGKFIGDNEVTDQKVRLRHDQYLRGRNDIDTADVPIVKINASNIPELGAELSAGGNKVTTLDAATAPGDAVRYEQAILITGDNAFTSDQSMGGSNLTNMADPINPQDAATKAYVDAVIVGSNWHVYTLSYTDLAFAGLTNSIELFELPAKGLISKVVIKHSTSFAGGAISAYTLSVGIAGNTAKYASAFDVFQAPAADAGQTSSVSDFESFTGSTSIVIEAVSTDDNLDQAATGDVEVYVYWEILP